MVSELGSRVRWLSRIDQEGFFVVHSSCRSRRDILFGLQGSRQQKLLVFRFLDVKEQQVVDSKGFLSSSIVRVCDKV